MHHTCAGEYRLESMRKEPPKGPPKEPKVTETVKRLLAVESEVRELRGELSAEVGGLRAELHEEVSALRADLNEGVDKLLAGLARLEAAIDRVAEIRPRLDALEVRVDRLERTA